jgi:flagellar protein FlaG
MDIGGIAKSPVVAPAHRPEPTVTAGAVRTELPKAASVQAPSRNSALRFEGRDDANRRAAVEAAMRDVIERHTQIDPETREVIHQAVDRETGEVVRQVPDDALLSLRAYAREMRQLENGLETSDGPRIQKIA